MDAEAAALGPMAARTRPQSFSSEALATEALLPPSGSLQSVLIVGSGVAGLQVAREVVKLGLDVCVLEANADVGGVWTRNYAGFGLQVPWRMYEFPEFPWPQELKPQSEYPSGEEVHEYIRAYARAFGLYDHVRLNCKLLRLRWQPGVRRWEAVYVDTVREKFFRVFADYVVVASGIYSQPYVPTYEGGDQYAGMQLHAKDFTDTTVARGRRVVIVGAGKTALDCVSTVVSARSATSVTMLYRQAHWPIPRRILGMSIRKLLFNRCMAGMMPAYYADGPVAKVASAATLPIRRLFWRGLESVITRQFKVTEQLRPRVGLPKDMFYGGQILDSTMDKLIRSSDVETVKGEINRFVRNGIILHDGSFLAADLVLYCTGYIKSYEYLDGDMRARLDLQKDGLYLYRNVLPPSVPHLAFVGSEVSTYNNILTSGLQATWLAGVLSGRVPLPPVRAMLDDVRAQQRWRREVMPGQRNRGSVLMLYMMQYHDQLVRDMGLQPHRKGFNLVGECFGAYTARDYARFLSHGNKDGPERLRAGSCTRAASDVEAAQQGEAAVVAAAAEPSGAPAAEAASAEAAAGSGQEGLGVAEAAACSDEMTLQAAAAALSLQYGPAGALPRGSHHAGVSGAGDHSRSSSWAAAQSTPQQQQQQLEVQQPQPQHPAPTGPPPGPGSGSACWPAHVEALRTSTQSHAHHAEAPAGSAVAATGGVPAAARALEPMCGPLPTDGAAAAAAAEQAWQVGAVAAPSAGDWGRPRHAGTSSSAGQVAVGPGSCLPLWIVAESAAAAPAPLGRCTSDDTACSSRVVPVLPSLDAATTGWGGSSGGSNSGMATTVCSSSAAMLPAACERGVQGSSGSQAWPDAGMVMCGGGGGLGPVIMAAAAAVPGGPAGAVHPHLVGHAEQLALRLAQDEQWRALDGGEACPAQLEAGAGACGSSSAAAAGPPIPPHRTLAAYQGTTRSQPWQALEPLGPHGDAATGADASDSHGRAAASPFNQESGAHVLTAAARSPASARGPRAPRKHSLDGEAVSASAATNALNADGPQQRLSPERRRPSTVAMYGLQHQQHQQRLAPRCPQRQEPAQASSSTSSSSSSPPVLAAEALAKGAGPRMLRPPSACADDSASLLAVSGPLHHGGSSVALCSLASWGASQLLATSSGVQVQTVSSPVYRMSSLEGDSLGAPNTRPHGGSSGMGGDGPGPAAGPSAAAAAKAEAAGQGRGIGSPQATTGAGTGAAALSCARGRQPYRRVSSLSRSASLSLGGVPE